MNKSNYGTRRTPAAGRVPPPASWLGVTIMIVEKIGTIDTKKEEINSVSMLVELQQLDKKGQKNVYQTI
ncbi:hypothetical protein EVAR_10780_1 [Eumeta japonica]|uniref:Uncharacterized protein n=1 Tax=Eumeta variegata TaxID=151549 RepID=A0A4C1W8I4_EUMVA|nr:hypothetical protein EVAR_10780_1 [Eumeta japonica]